MSSGTASITNFDGYNFGGSVLGPSGSPEGLNHFVGGLVRLANLRFAATVSPEDPAVSDRLARVSALREQDRITVPSTIGEEKRTNPFLRAADPQLRQACEARFGEAPETNVDSFAALRRWKDSA